MPEDHLNVELYQAHFSPGFIGEAIQQAFAYFGYGPAYGTGVGATHMSGLLATLYTWWQVYSVIALLVSAVLLYGIIYSRVRINELYAIWHDRLHKEEEKWKELYGAKAEDMRIRSIEAKASSENPSDWRLAIIEADIHLESLLEEHHIPGTTIGERLKSMSRETFRALDDAWAAHKVRNDIAHRGSDFVLSKRLVNETIAHYRKAFDELANGAKHH